MEVPVPASRVCSPAVSPRPPSRLLPPYGEEQCARANGAGSRGTLHIGVSLARRFRPSSLPRPRSPTPRSLGSSSPRAVDSARNGFYCDACRWARPGACSYGSGRSVYFWRPSQASSVLSLSLSLSLSLTAKQCGQWAVSSSGGRLLCLNKPSELLRRDLDRRLADRWSQLYLYSAAL